VPVQVGFLIGISFMLVMGMLQVGVVSGANFAALGAGELKSATQAVTAFSSLLFIAITTFTVFLTLYRDTLLPPPMASTDQSSSLPPASGGFPAASPGAATTFTTYSLGQSAPASDLGAGGGYGGGAGGYDKYGMDAEAVTIGAGSIGGGGGGGVPGGRDAGVL